MQLVVLSNDELKEELLAQGSDGKAEFTWISSPGEFALHQHADGYIDLLFDNTAERVSLLARLSAKPVIVNSVVATLTSMNAPFIRINAWPGFLKRSLVEASYKNDNIKEQAERIFSFLNKKTEWIIDQPGFVTARVIAMIINEAYFALGEDVSTKEEIDAAMILGTNYPYGPFEWCSKIGIKNVYRLLSELSGIKARYQPAVLLEKEALA